jgi:hypothetical protein
MLKSGLAFVASHIQVDGDLPTTLIPGHVFRRARDEEIVLIQEQLRQSMRGQFYQWVHYEATIREERRGTSTTFHVESLPRDQWKYWVVAFEPNNHTIHEIETVGLLLPTDLEFAFQIYFSEPAQSGEIRGMQVMPLHIFEKYSSYDCVFANATSLTTQQLATISELWRLYKNMPTDFSFVASALDNFSALRRVPLQASLSVVGLFSIIESLTTHAPRLTETLDSINHQITNKIILLQKRYARPVTPDQYFLSSTEEKIWKKLYGYRSSIAHGSIANFNAEYQVLRDHSTVVRFLRDNVKELIIFALRNSEFLSDLRRC